MRASKSKLPRLSDEFYQGRAYVFWTHTTEHRRKLPLNTSFSTQFRENLLHSCARYDLLAPVYVCMPDHIHLLWIGYAEGSDQKNANKFLRRQLRTHLGNVDWQRQAHDHVLREKERQRGNLEDTIQYICKNPERAGIVDDWRKYPHLGTMIPGYPEIDVRKEDFTEKLWKAFGILSKTSS